MPFGFAWTDQPSPFFERSFLQYHWSTRASFSPAKWSLDLGVWAEGKLVGTQGIDAENFAVLRSVSTGSWLAREFQGHKERTLKGSWVAAGRQLAAGTIRVDMKQPLARLAFYLIEPRADDGLVDWNILDEAIGESKVYPIVRSRR